MLIDVYDCGVLVTGCCNEEPREGCPLGISVVCSKNRAVVQYCISYGLSGFQYLITDLVDVVPI